MKQRHLFSAVLLLAGASVLRVQADQPVEVGSPGIIHHRTNPKYGNQPPAGGTGATTPLTYHGGPVLGTPVAYVIWYGNWNQNDGTDTLDGQQIVRDFLKGISASPYFMLNTTYPGPAITGTVQFGGEATDSYSQGSRLTDQRVGNVVARAITSGAFGGVTSVDPNGVYFVLTSKDVTESSGFCTRYCGWHTHGYLNGADVKYAFVGNAARCLNACAAQAIGPNGNAGVDAMISVIAHELEEATTDPDLNAWYDSSGAENADKCAWTFGQNQYPVTSGPGTGAYANMKLGTRDFLIQRNIWWSGSGYYCHLNATQN